MLCILLSGVVLWQRNGKPVLAQKPAVVYLYNGDEAEEEGTALYQTGDSGRFTMIYNDAWLYGEIVRTEFRSDNNTVVQVDGEGNYRIVGGGRAVVAAKGYNSEGVLVFEASYCFTACADLSGASLGKSSLNTYILNGAADTVKLPLKNAPELTYYTFEYISSNTGMNVACVLNAETKTIEIYSGTAGTTTLTFTINGRTFQLKLKTTKITLKKISAVLAKKKTTKLKVSGFSGKVNWRSTNKKVASVSSNGIVKGKKTGNAVVYASFGGRRIGCAVSVVTPKMKKVINEAKKIAKGKYSQAKRMQKGYYDCSSLVWRSYKKAGKYFGDKNYAPVAANIAKWCFGKKKRIKGGLSYKNIQNRKLRPGDLFFEGGADNGRYKGIYHVEMFIGYQCEGFDENNKPIMGTLWAARPANCYWSGMMARP